MLLKHHVGDREDRFTGFDGVDRFGIGVVVEAKQADRGVNRGQQRVVVAIERDQLFKEAEQLPSLLVAHQHGRHVGRTVAGACIGGAWGAHGISLVCTQDDATTGPWPGSMVCDCAGCGSGPS